MTTGTAGTADAMHIDFGIVGDVEIDDVTDAIDVEAARRDVGRDQQIELAILELLDGFFTHLLRHIAIQRRAGIAACFEALGQFDGRDLGAHENQHALVVLGFEYARQRIELV